jgi:hypothetical protein
MALIEYSKGETDKENGLKMLDNLMTKVEVFSVLKGLRNKLVSSRRT